MTTPSLFNTPPASAPSAKPQFTPGAVPPKAPAPVVVASSPLVPLTEDDVKKALPQHLRASVTQNLVDTLNTISTDPIAAENIRDNFVGYLTVLKDGKFKTEDYLHAVAYVSFKLMGYTNEDAYGRAHPQRYARLIAQGTSKKDISAYVSAYHRGKLVNLIMEQSLVPTWVLNQDLFQKAINVQAELMVSANSEKVRTDAANSLLTHLKKPEPKGDFQVNINPEDSNGMKDLRNSIAELARQQQDLIRTGQAKTIDIAASKLIDRAGATDV